jgi:hypothetical protein
MAPTISSMSNSSKLVRLSLTENGAKRTANTASPTSLLTFSDRVPKNKKRRARPIVPLIRSFGAPPAEKPSILAQRGQSKREKSEIGQARKKSKSQRLIDNEQKKRERSPASLYS